MTDPRLCCRCRLSCDQRATQEDMLCNDCRDPNHAHAFVAPLGSDPADKGEWAHIGFTREGFTVDV